MRILVTGATGFLGRVLVDHLRRDGHGITALGRNTRVLDSLGKLGVRTVVGDLADYGVVQKCVSGQDFVMHCGALSSVWGQYQDFYRSNVQGTKNIVRGILESGQSTSLIHVSTPSIYIGSTRKLSITEEEPIPTRGINDYAETKRQAEIEIIQAVDQGLRAVILRPQGIFGPGDTALVPRLLRANLKTGIPLFGDGNHLIDVTYVDNVASLMMRCLEYPEKGENGAELWKGRAYNVTNGQPVKFASFIGEVLQKLAVTPRFRRMPLPVAKSLVLALEGAYRAFSLRGEPPLTRYTLEVLSQPRTLSIDRARKELGYHPKVGIEEGVDQFVKWWQEVHKTQPVLIHD